MYFPVLLTAQSIRTKFLCVLAITSLAVTAYTLLFVPLPSQKKTDIKGKRPMRDLNLDSEVSPVERYIGVLNVALSVLVCLNGLTLRDKAGVHENFYLLCFVPGCRFRRFKSHTCNPSS